MLNTALLFAGCAVVSFVVGDWIAGLSVLLLVLAWTYLPKQDAPPILAMAFTYQWAQVTIGIFYCGLTGRWLPALEVDYRTMVLLGLGSVTMLFFGVAFSDKVLSRILPRPETWRDRELTMASLIAAYLLMTAIQGTVLRFAWAISGLSEGVLALMAVRLGIAFLLLRRFVSPRMQWFPFLGLLGFEVVLGFTGYFANFREIEALALVAVLETWKRVRFRQVAWVVALALAMVVSGFVWTGIKTQLRARWDTEKEFSSSLLKRVEALAYLSGDNLLEWEQMQFNADLMVARFWAVYYPAMALQRVPNILPHENGAILLGAFRHIFTPRLFYPDKPPAFSDSDMVRKYSGVWVAGSETNTSIAFGYAIESYVDFGFPAMLLPALIFGLVVGIAYRFLLVFLRHKEVAITACVIIIWTSLYIYERSWLRTIGITGTMLIFVGGFCYIVDRYITASRSEGLVTGRQNLPPVMAAGATAKPIRPRNA